MHCWCWLPSYYCHFTLALNAAQILLVAHNKSSFFFLWRRNLILKLNLVTQDQSRAEGDCDARDPGLHGHKTPPRPLPVPQVVSRGPPTWWCLSVSCSPWCSCTHPDHPLTIQQHSAWWLFTLVYKCSGHSSNKSSSFVTQGSCPKKSADVPSS